MPNIKKIGMLSFAVLIAQLILTKALYPIIGRQTQTLFSINPISGIGGRQIGDNILGYLSGYIPFDLMNFGVLLSIYIGAFVITGIGFWLYEQRALKLPQGSNLTGRLFYILLYGHVALYLVLWLLKQGVPGIAWNLLIGLGINLFLLSAIVTISANKLKWPKV